MEPEVIEPKKPGMPGRPNLYQQLQKLAPKALLRLEGCLDSNNENVRLGALKIIYDRMIPTLKSIELNGGVDDNGNRQPIQLFVNSGRGFVPATVVLPTSSAGSLTGGQSQIQSPGMAPTSTQDDNGNIGSNQTGTP